MLNKINFCEFIQQIYLILRFFIPTNKKHKQQVRVPIKKSLIFVGQNVFIEMSVNLYCTQTVDV